MKYKSEILDYLSYWIAVDDAGIYPQSSVDSHGITTKRTEFQEGWNECVLEITKSADIISSFLDTLPDTIIEYIIQERIGIYVRDNIPKLYVLCNDLFCWACSDSEDFELSDIDSFNQALKDSEKNGDLLWVCRKRGMRPQTPYYKYFTEEEARLFNECGPKREDT